MSLDIASLRSILVQGKPENAAGRVLAVLDSPDLTVGRLNPIRNSAGKVLSLWRTREKISKHTGTCIPGVAHLNSHLSRMSPDAMVDQYNFDTGTLAGSIFIDPSTGKFLGDTIVERNNKYRQGKDLEDRVSEPSRKSA